MEVKHLDWRRTSIIVLVTIILTSLGVSASDQLQGYSTKMLGMLPGGDKEVCQENSVLVTYGTHAVCMDTYEAAPVGNCLYEDPKSELETNINVSNEKCLAKSVSDHLPWRFVNQAQAAQLCARVGKRLPTNDEWYKVALGTVSIESCVLKTVGPKVGDDGGCDTALGVKNLVGNVWEWTSETVTDKSFNGRTLPDSGYVSSVDDVGVVVETQSTGTDAYGSDFASVADSGVSGILRGGFYGSKEDGGIFSQNLAAPLNLTAVGVGFRCVKDVW